MPITMTTPAPDDVVSLAETLDLWQLDGGPLQLHPGDLGWFSMRGTEATASAMRVWLRDGRPVAIGLLDGDDLLRLGIAPPALDDGELAAAIAGSVSDPSRGVLPDGGVSVEARGADALAACLIDAGWSAGDPWVPLHRDLTDPVEPTSLRVEVVEGNLAEVWSEVHFSAFRGGDFTDAVRERMVHNWQTLAAGPLYDRARSLLGRDEAGTPVAAAAVWSVGHGRPGLIEPLAVRRGQQGKGFGRAMTLACASVLRDLGASSATVCAEASNPAAVATYASAGFTAAPEVPDLRRHA